MSKAQKKRLTQREKAERAAAKKWLQERGVLPPDKPRLNRKKFAADVRAEWKAADGPLYAYVMASIGWMLPDDGGVLPVTPEQLGVLKLLKIALATKAYEDALPEGVHKYNAVDFFRKVIEPIVKL